MKICLKKAININKTRTYNCWDNKHCAKIFLLWNQLYSTIEIKTKNCEQRNSCVESLANDINFRFRLNRFSTLLKFAKSCVLNDFDLLFTTCHANLIRNYIKLMVSLYGIEATIGTPVHSKSKNSFFYDSYASSNCLIS